MKNLINMEEKYNMKWLVYFALGLVIVSCQKEVERSDAYGNFEATELMVSSELPGKIMRLDVQEGQHLRKGAPVALVDTTLLALKKQTLLASIRSIGATRQDVRPQLAVLEAEKRHLLHEKERVHKLIAGHAATQKQLDDLEAQLTVLDQKMRATKAKYRDINRNVALKVDPLQSQIDQIEAQMDKATVHNPIDGTVLRVYKHAGEMAAPGFPLYKIADMSSMELRAYVSGTQLPHIKTGQEVEVLIDDTAETNKSLKGVISWISDKAEFTPKTIQTKEERVTQVYAIKVVVKNDGSIKIGMPGEINFGSEE